MRILMIGEQGQVLEEKGMEMKKMKIVKIKDDLIVTERKIDLAHDEEGRWPIPDKHAEGLRQHRRGRNGRTAPREQDWGCRRDGQRDDGRQRGRSRDA